jgi:rod shape-determining protein MreC
MYTLRRWWDRYGLKIGLIALALGIAWGLRYTRGEPIFEIYQALSRPFQGQPSQTDILADARIREFQQRVVELEQQNQTLKELIGYASSRSTPGVVAPVIGRSADHWWQQVTLGRGNRDGIQQGAVVSGTGGIVGRVVQVTPNTSRVLLISDPTSQIGVVVSRSRSMGYMRGQSANRAVMEFFDKVPDVRPGDTIATSSFSQLFPPGLPIGTVESINLDQSPAPEAVIDLSAPIGSLEWVVVDPRQSSSPASQSQ